MAGNFYLCWLLLVTIAFLYNAAVGPLRTAFSRAPIYNVTGVYPAHDPDSNDTNVTYMYYVIYNVTDAGSFCQRIHLLL